MGSALNDAIEMLGNNERNSFPINATPLKRDGYGWIINRF
jgi:hypothetical protein